MLLHVRASPDRCGFPGADAREPDLQLHRIPEAGISRYGIFVWVDETASPSDHWRTIYIFCSADDECELVSGGVYHF